MNIWVKGFVIGFCILASQILLVFLCGYFAWEEASYVSCDLFCSPNFLLADRGFGFLIQAVLYYGIGLMIAGMFSYEKPNS